MRFSRAARMISLALLCALLCGCTGGGRERERFESLRALVKTANCISFHAEIRADGGDAVSEYALDCVASQEETTLQLLSPKLISGVTAHIRSGSASLEFDGLSFEAGAADKSGLSPLLAPSILLSALRCGVVSELRTEMRCGVEAVACSVLCTNGYYADLWIDSQTCAPCYAEILSEGRAALAITVTDWRIKEDDTSERTAKEDLGGDQSGEHRA